MSDRRPVKIASFSGAMGDKFSAFEEALHVDGVDVAIGDSMAEITMSMVASGFAAGPEGLRKFYSELFVRQLFPHLEFIAERGIKVVTNAGIFNPAGLAETIGKEVANRGLQLRVAYVTGDDLTDEVARLVTDGQLTNMDTGAAMTLPPDEVLVATAYLGGWGIKTALDEGADIVITGRVADASLVTGAAAWWHRWNRNELNKIAGATAAAHVIECGAQATGGNFSGFSTIEHRVLPGFPIAEVDADGSFVITKRDGDAGAVTVDTVTAQLLYEIQGPLYLNSDVTWHTDSVRLTQEGPNRVRATDIKGSAPSTTTKVGVHHQRGYRGSLWLYPTGLEIPEKIAVLKAQAERARQDHPVDELHFFVCGRPVDDPKDQWQATVPVQVAVAAEEQKTVAGFLNQLASYGLGSIPGFYVDLTQAYTMTGLPRIDYWPGLVRQDSLHERVHLDDGRVLDVAPPPGMQPFQGQPETTSTATDPGSFGPTARVPFGNVVYARVGDKGSNANMGVWVRNKPALQWLTAFLTADKLRELLGCPEDVTIERYEQPLLHGLSFVLRDYFQPSGSANLALDQIGKSLGEFLRARHVEVPLSVLES